MLGHFLFVCLLLFPFLSCTDHMQERVAIALNFSKDNKQELEKVLSYYKGQPSKLKAAQFLIANMPYHYTYVGWEIDTLKQLKKRSITEGKISEEVIQRWNYFNFMRLPHEYDIHKISSAYLIENIDLAFEVWENRPWSKYYSFEDSCEYILAYRIEDEPLESWRRKYYDRYMPILDSLYQGTDVVEAAQKMADYLKTEGFAHYNDFSLPHLGPLFLLDSRVGYCRENCDIATYVMRAVGIPISMDFYEIAPSYNRKHFWSALIDTTHLVVPFNYEEEPMSRKPRPNERKRGKVYRICYGVQPERIKGIFEDKCVPPLFRHPFLKDVTNEYFPDSRVTVELDKTSKDGKAYLSIFSIGQLRAIAITEVKGNRADFDFVEPDVSYFSSCMIEGKNVSAGYAFTLKNNAPDYFIPDTTSLVDVTLYRKYPMRSNVKNLGNTCGLKIEGADTYDFMKPELLYEVVDTPKVNYNILKVNPKKKYRYIRYSAPKDKFIELAEWRMYAENISQPITPQNITADHPLSELHRKNLDLMDDNDWVSFYMSEVVGEQLIFDLGKPYKLDHILFMPRNDDNFIHLGDSYELFYHAGAQGWISLGKRMAEDTELHYDNVPEGALLWLHNYTRGEEERAFYMKQGKQVFL